MKQDRVIGDWPKTQVAQKLPSRSLLYKNKASSPQFDARSLAVSPSAMSSSQDQDSFLRRAMSPCSPVKAIYDQEVQIEIESSGNSDDCEISSPSRPEEENRSKDICIGASTFSNMNTTTTSAATTTTEATIAEPSIMGPKRALGHACSIKVMSNPRDALGNKQSFGLTPEPPSFSSAPPSSTFKSKHKQRKHMSPLAKGCKRMALSPRHQMSVENHINKQKRANENRIKEQSKKQQQQNGWEVRASIDRQKTNRRNEELLRGKQRHSPHRKMSPQQLLSRSGTAKNWIEDSQSQTAIDLLTVSRHTKQKMKQKSYRLVQSKFNKEWNFILDELFPNELEVVEPSQRRVSEQQFEYTLDRMFFLKSHEELKKLDDAFFQRSYMVGLSPSEQQQCLVGTAFELLNPYRPSEPLQPGPHIVTPFQLHMFNKAEAKRINTISVKNLETFARVLLNIREDKSLNRSTSYSNTMFMINGTTKLPYGLLAPSPTFQSKNSQHYRSLERLGQTGRQLLEPEDETKSRQRRGRNQQRGPVSFHSSSPVRGQNVAVANQDIVTSDGDAHKEVQEKQTDIFFDSNPPTAGTTTPNTKEPIINGASPSLPAERSRLQSHSRKASEEEQKVLSDGEREQHMPMTAESAGEAILSDIQVDQSASQQHAVPLEQHHHLSPDEGGQVFDNQLNDLIPVSDFRDAPDLFRQFIFNRTYKTHENQIKLTEGRHVSSHDTFHPKISRKSTELAFKQVKKAERMQREVNNFFRSLKMESFAINVENDQVKLVNAHEIRKPAHDFVYEKTDGSELYHDHENDFEREQEQEPDLETSEDNLYQLNTKPEQQLAKPKNSGNASLSDRDRLKEPQMKVEFDMNNIEKLEKNMKLLQDWERESAKEVVEQDKHYEQDGRAQSERGSGHARPSDYRSKQKLLTPQGPDVGVSLSGVIGMYDVQEESCEESFDNAVSEPVSGATSTTRSVKRRPARIESEEMQQEPPVSLGEESQTEWEGLAQANSGISSSYVQNAKPTMIGAGAIKSRISAAKPDPQFQGRDSVSGSSSSRHFSGYFAKTSDADPENEMNFDDDDMLLDDCKLSQLKEVEVLRNSTKKQSNDSLFHFYQKQQQRQNN